MDERLRILLEAQDRAAAAYRQVASHNQQLVRNLRQVQQAAAQMSSSSRSSLAGLNTSLRASSTQAGTAGRSIAASLGVVSVAAGRAVSALRQLPSAIAQAAAAASRARGPLSGLAGFALNRAVPGLGMVSGAAGLLGGLGAGAAGVAFGKRGVEMNLTRQSGLTAMTSLLGGDRGRAESFFAELEKEAAQSLPTLKDLIPLATQLIQAYGPQGLGKVLPTIRAFGDAAAIAAGGDTNRMELALLGFRQILNRGVVQQEELNQIGENLGVNVGGFLRGRFGTADTEELGKRGVTGGAAADAIVAGLQAQFGGAQARQSKTLPGLTSNIDDALNTMAGRATETMTKSLGGAMEKVLQALNKALERGSLIKSMEVIFQTFGKVVEGVAGQLERVFKWIEQIAKAEGLKLFLVNAIALAQTLGDRLLKLFGVDLQKAMDPKNVTAWFDALGEGVTNAINTAFGLGRVWNEVVGKIIPGAFVDLRDSITDFATDTARTFQGMFFRIEASINDFAAALLGAFVTMADALNNILGKIRWPNGQRVFEGIDVNPLLDAQSAAAGRATANRGFASDLARQGEAAAEARRQREAAKDRADPFRHQDPFTRIWDAFTGRNRDMSAQAQFWADFDRNRLGVARGLFGRSPAAPGPPGLPPGVPAAPQMFSGGGGGMGSVTVVPNGPAIPAFPGSMGMPGGGTGVNVVNVNVQSPGLSAILRADPAFAAALQEFINLYLASQQQLAYPGPAMP